MVREGEKEGGTRGEGGREARENSKSLTLIVYWQEHINNNYSLLDVYIALDNIESQLLYFNHRVQVAWFTILTLEKYGPH